METRFIKIDAEKSPFLAERLKIVLLPTVVMTRDGHTIDMLEGFDDLGGNDKFTTKDMEKRLARNGAIDYEEEAVNPNAKRYNNKNNQSGKAIYQSRRAQMMENIEDDLEDLSDLSD